MQNLLIMRWRTIVAMLCAAFSLSLVAQAQSSTADDGSANGAAGGTVNYSPAERLLFMIPQLENLSPPAVLHYNFKKSGSLESGFEDSVTLHMTQKEGRCCAVQGDFFSAERRFALPEVLATQGNPVTLYFLEHDVREMKRLTQGSDNYFRKLIRMAIYQGAEVRDVALPYLGRTVEAKEITISPFLDDPNRSRYAKFASKSYHFMLSPSVPGGVYGIRTVVPGAAAAPPLMVEELLIAGANTPVN